MIHDPNREAEAEYWDDYIKEFGVGAYVKARYEDGIQYLAMGIHGC